MKFRELLCKYIAMRVVSMIDLNKLIYDLIPWDLKGRYTEYGVVWFSWYILVQFHSENV